MYLHAFRMERRPRPSSRQQYLFFVILHRYPVTVYSDVHMLGYLLHQQYQNNPQQWASDECTRWDAQEDLSNDNNGVPSFLSSVPACPCTLQQARLDPSRFLEQRGGCAVNANAQSCTREGASNRICFLSTYSAYGAECCYDVTNNNLVFSLDDPTGGSSDKAALLGLSPYNQAGSIPFLSHWGVDVMPYHLCCRWSGPEQCRRYLENRRSKGCAEYPHRDSALIFGDPHFITFDQRRFTFNGIGEYRVMEVSGSDFKLYGRTTVATDSRRDDAMVASFLNAVAMQETGSDVVHVELGYQRPLNIYYDQGNGFRQPDMFLNGNAYDPLFLKGVTVHFSSDFRQILVAFQSSKVVVVVQAFTYGISAEVIAVNADFPGTAAVTGLLGDMNGDPNDDIKGTNGALYEGNDPETLFAVVKEWTTSGNTIFHNHPALNSEDYQNASFVPVLVTPDPSSLDPIIANQLEATCRGLQECLYDMSVTQTVVAGQDCYKENADYEEVRSNVLKKVETCSYIPSPYNGQVAYSDDFKKNAVGTSVTFSCGNPKAILIGPQTRECQSGATWSNAEMPVCTETNCNTNDFKGADVIETGRDQEGNLRVVFGCPGTTVEYTLTCKGGEWQGGGPIDCSTGGAVGLSGGAIAGVVIGCLLGVVLIAVLVLFVLRRRETGVKDLENTGTKVNAPADNWGMDAEARDAAASIGTNLKHAREV
ncbi:sushi domain-containing protein 2-like isoform X2 [Acanthaster planci]|uniref:Sushi domain-containing protein 2-like isoform X2 n=1 Tax=Acanthaster planci TaxID=133434 RepID=A0A8B7Z2S6_ACAPL|nr:sushi domain-containing protein 2-like isoform X2 [Acanthaster planci]